MTPGEARLSGGIEMAGENVPWLGSVEEARPQAREQNKLVLIDLFNPG